MRLALYCGKMSSRIDSSQTGYPVALSCCSTYQADLQSLAANAASHPSLLFSLCLDVPYLL